MNPKCQPAEYHRVFDIDVYDCPCGHPYGSHDYGTMGGLMLITACLDCEAGVPPGQLPIYAPSENLTADLEFSDPDYGF